LEQGWAPSKLTPYLVRRDADRWQQSGRRDKSILYRGRQLLEAQDLRAAQPDLVTGPAIDVFLAASAAAQSRRARYVTVTAIAVAVAIGILAVQREMSRRLALSRFVAAEARQMPSPDAGLLMAVQATRISETPEAFGALMERLDEQPYLRHMIRSDYGEVRSLAFDPESTALYAGHANGVIARIDVHTLAVTRLARATTGAVFSIDVDAAGGEVWAGLEDGRVLVYDRNGSYFDVPGIAGSASLNDAAALNRHKLGDAILSLQIDPNGRFVAAGDHGHRLVLVDKAKRAVVWTKRFTAQRITSVSFSVDGTSLAAGSSDGLVEIFAVPSGNSMRTFTTARTGNPAAVQFARNGDLRVIDNELVFTVVPHASTQAQTERIEGKLLSAASVGPRREFGPGIRRDLLLVGFASGDVLFTPVAGEGTKVRVAAHARQVNAAALSADGAMAATAAGDGSIAIWDLIQRSRLVERFSPPSGEIVALAYNSSDKLLAVISSGDRAALVEHGTQGWNENADLVAISMRGAGSQATQVESELPDAEGFVPVPGSILLHAVFNETASHLAWVTRTGALFWAAIAAEPNSRFLRQESKDVRALAIGTSGRYVFVAEGDGDLICYDALDTAAQPRRYKTATAIRRMVAIGVDPIVIVATDDAQLRRIDFSGQQSPKETMRIELPGTAAQLANLSGTEVLLAGGAGASADIDVGLVDAGKYTRLHSRRLGGAASAMAISRSAQLIALADLDGRLHLLDLDTRVPMASLQLTDAAVNGLAFASDGRQLAVSTGADGSVLEVNLDREKWRSSACDVVQRELTPAEWTALVSDASLKPGCAEPALPALPAFSGL